MVYPPSTIDGFVVREYGYFAQPIFPLGYVAAVGKPHILPVKNLAICTSNGVTGFYLLYCTDDWQSITSSYNETLEATKCNPTVEFGEDVLDWHTPT
jgi:hypothetical protein